MRDRVRIALVAGLTALAVIVAGPGRSEAGGLADDGRVGVVTDLVGTALVRPAGHRRSSPVGPRSVLLPGDEVRTMARGAHAAEIRFADGGSMVLGPGGLAVLEARGKVRLVQGDAEFAGAAGHPVAVTAPGGFAAAIEAATVLRAEGGAAVPLAAAPRWLTGYRGSTTDEWMGSLLAKVDGRNVPLTVGYHKVDVAIRDQIAETTVEESFVNSTDVVLEGVFSFPLPADASISGFGMWIGEEFVAADIVERQRAREIYEDIRSRRKDPGLLEWSGGNLFQASVFPIPAHAEKRIRVRYTQVLPMEGTLLRYRYALRSEMLRTHPLRQLQVHVAVQSAAPVVSASSPTHEVRVTQTAHAATLDFSAAEFTPDRDFEIVVGLDAASPLRVLPHRRGDDGYFMLLFAPPDASAGAWKRELVPEGDPLDVVFVADTSGSMGPAERAAQRAFLASALALMGPEDRFKLMAFDAEVAWLASEALPVNDENAARAAEFLDARWSLGWTDLDQAMAAAAAKAGKGSLIVYLGDGIGTTGDADPVALAQRIARIELPAGASIHAIATGSAYEQGVLEAMAARGGGSVRSTGDDPARSAYAWLAEIAQPAVKDVQVAFEGLRTARVYPPRLPNVQAGTQQIVLGRFLPEGGAEQRGRVTVTGTLAGRPVRYSAEVAVAANESGNSFLPRLWARRHLDALLAEGRTPGVRDEIVSFSENFGIITPYTSFLVLENDADRELYGVKRRVAMRDGERFFTEGRTAVATAALRDQMLKARSWRLGLRRRMLAEITDLGRGLYESGAYAFGIVGDGRRGGGGGGGGGWSSGGTSTGGSEFAFRSGLESRLRTEDGYFGPADEAAREKWDTSSYSDFDFEAGESADRKLSEDDGDGAYEEDGPVHRDEVELPMESAAAKSAAPWAGNRAVRLRGALERAASGPMTGFVGGRANKPWGQADYNLRPDNSWMGQQLFQRFPGLPVPPAPAPAPEPVTWDAEVAALLASVSEPAGPAPGAEDRVEIAWRDGSAGPDAPDFRPANTGRALVANARWFVRGETATSEPRETWLADDRGALAAGTRLGRRRPAAEADRGAWADAANRNRFDFSRGYAKWTARILTRDGSRVVVELKAPGESAQRLLVTIDTEMRVVVEQRSFNGDQLVSTHRRTGFVRAGGLWWATAETSLDGDGRETWRRTLAVRELPAAEFDAAFKAALAGQEDVIFLAAEDPALAPAKQAVHEGRGTFADLLTITAAHAATQRWDEAWAAWEKARALVPAKPGADWIEATLGTFSRAGERFDALARRMAASIAASKGPAAHALALDLDGLAERCMQVDERLRLLDALEAAGPAAADPAESRWRSTYWRQWRAATLASGGRWHQAVEIRRALWKDRPGDLQSAVDLMNTLAQTGDVDGALEIFRAADLTEAKRPQRTWQVQQLLQQLTNVLWNAMRFKEVIEVADRWIDIQPEAPQGWHDRLSALLALGRIDDVDRWIAERITAAEGPGDDRVAIAQWTAAIDVALGQDRSGRWYAGQADTKWTRPLAALARRLAREEKDGTNLAGRIISNYWFQQGDGHRELIQALRTDLVADGVVEGLAPSRLLTRVSWLPWDRDDVDAAVWRGVTNRVDARRREAKDAQEREVLFRCVLTLLDAHSEPDEAVRVVRDELAAAAPERAPQLAGELLGRVVREPWSQAIEDEAFALVPRIVAADQPADTVRAQFAQTARRLAEQLSALRREALLPPRVEREKLPRAELKALTARATADVRRALAARLAKEVQGAPELLRPWYEIERICLAAELGEDVGAVEASAREMLLSITPSADDGISWILRERCVLVLSHLAARRDAPEGLAERVVSLLRERLAAEAASLDWRWAIFRLLVALDRPQEIETALRAWIVPSLVESRWRIALGYVLAETGRMADAAAQFEEVARLDELAEAEFVALADWYLALGDDAHRESARDRRYARVDEYVLRNRVSRERWRVQSHGRDGVPPSMDDEILAVIRALLAKASRPENHLYEVRSLYGTVKDFRLLASLADGVVGHTPEAVYALLAQTGDVVRDVHEEATCDELRARLDERIASARTDTDRRGLVLLMVQVERRAADVLNQPGPHGERALAALRRARQGSWLPGERRLMADFLAALGAVPDAALAAEQVSQLRELHGLETPGGLDRMAIAHAIHRTERAYGRADAAIDGLVAALEEHRQAQGGLLPVTANAAVDDLMSAQVERGRFTAMETWLADETARQTAPAQRQWYAREMFQLCVRCLERDGTMSLGAGADLYRAARETMHRALADHAPDHLAELLGHYCALHRAAHGRRGAHEVKGVGEDLVAFSRTLLPELLPRFGQQGPSQAQTVAGALHDVAGPLPALTFLVERLEAEPEWVRRRGGDGWNAFGCFVAEWRREVRALGPLEERLLAVVLRELERDLLSQEARNRYLYGSKGSNGFWTEKAGDFARVARRVIAENQDAPGRLRHAANYLWHGLRLHDEAVRTLEDADLRGVLREDGRWDLVGWHQEKKCWRESLPHAQRLVAERPDRLDYRIANVRALHGVLHDDEGRALVDATRDHCTDLVARRMMTTGANAQLADVCLDCGWFERCVPLYVTALSEHRRATRRGRNDGTDPTVPRLYGSLARAHAGLRHFDEAVDAASAAVVAWGPTDSSRGDALQALRDVLAAIPDLPAWTARWEDEAAKSGLDAPVVRLALARIHLDRREPDAALRQLLVARRHTPDDAAVHADVVRAYEMKSDAEGVCAALSFSLEHLPSQPDLYPRLAERLAKLGRRGDAERALTGLAEYAPNDAEGHRRLAVLRRTAGRHDDAVLQWRQVVRIRTAEIDGWMELARSLAHAGRKDEAHATLDEFLRTPSGAGQRTAVEKVSREIGGN